MVAIYLRLYLQMCDLHLEIGKLVSVKIFLVWLILISFLLLHIHAEYEGRVLSAAMTQGFTVLEGKYYLGGDAGYDLSKIYLTPYRGVRYHLKEWNRGNRRPPTLAREELHLIIVVV